MTTTFNTLLVEAGLDLSEVRLLRHADPKSAPGRTPFHLWHGNRAKFDRYQSSQHMDERTRSKLKSKYWASFVGTPEGETLFVGVYGVRYLCLLPKDEPAPHRDSIDKAGTLDEYELVLDERLSDRIGRLYVDWGETKKRVWIQRADQQDKPIDEGPRNELPSYVARICWNSKGWIGPTGDAAPLEAKSSYAADKGFGHEEWLFDPEAALDGWQYGFLQPVNKSHGRVAGRTIQLRLWTIGPGRTWYYVGQLPACQVLTHDEAEAAVKQFAASGRLARMEAQARAVGGNPSDLRASPLYVANVRFRAEGAEIQDPLVPASEGHAIRDLKRYMLVGSGDRWWKVLQEWPVDGRRPPLAATPTYPDEMHLPVTGHEGGTRTELVNKYERDSTLRNACLKHYGPGCFVCGMTFEALYGPDFAGMACHVHHLTMISTFGGFRPVDPIKDLRPVCPNCHAAIHQRRDEPYTPEDIQERRRRLQSPPP